MESVLVGQELLDAFLTSVQPRNDVFTPLHERPDPRFGRFMQDGTPRMSPSQVNLVWQCPGKWRLQYLLGAPQKQGWQADLGSIGHAGIEAYLAGADYKDVLSKAYDAVLIHLHRTSAEVFQNPPGAPEHHASALQGALSNLMVWVETSQLKLLGLEEDITQFYTVNGVKVGISGRYDARVEDNNGRRFVLDWKFPGRSYPGPSRQEYQYATAVYYDALNASGHKLDGFGIIHAGQDGGEVKDDFYRNPDDLVPWSQDRTRGAIERVLSGDLPFDTVGPGALCSQKWCSYHATNCDATRP